MVLVLRSLLLENERKGLLGRVEKKHRYFGMVHRGPFQLHLRWDPKNVTARLLFNAFLGSSTNKGTPKGQNTTVLKHSKKKLQ